MRELVLLVSMWTVTICTYISYVPQLYKLVKTKSSEDLSISAWVLWTIGSVCNVVYSLALARVELIVATVSETLLCTTVLILNLVYKNKRRA